MSEARFNKYLTSFISELFNVNMGTSERIANAIKDIPSESLSFVKGIKESTVGEYKFEDAMPSNEKNVLESAGQQAVEDYAASKASPKYTSGQYADIKSTELDKQVTEQFNKKYKVELDALKNSIGNDDKTLALSVAIGSGMDESVARTMIDENNYVGLKSAVKSNLKNKFYNQYLTAVQEEVRPILSLKEMQDIQAKYDNSKDRALAFRAEAKLAYQAAGVTDSPEFKKPKGLKFMEEWMGSLKSYVGNLHQASQKAGLKTTSRILEGMHGLLDNQTHLRSYLNEHENSIVTLLKSYGDQETTLRKYIDAQENVIQQKVSYGAAEHTLAIKPKALTEAGIDINTEQGLKFVKDATKINNSLQSANEMMAQIHMNKYDAPGMSAKFNELDDTRWYTGIKRDSSGSDAEIQLAERAYNRDNYFPIVINDDYKKRLKSKLDPLYDSELEKSLGELPDDYNHHAVYSSYQKRRGTKSGASMDENRLMPHKEIENYFNSVKYTMFKKKLMGDIEAIQHQLFMPTADKQTRSLLSQRLSTLSEHIDNAYKIPRSPDDYAVPELFVKSYSRLATVAGLSKPQMIIFGNMTQSIMNAGMYRGNWLVGYAKGAAKTLELMGKGVSEVTKQIMGGEGVNLDNAFKNILSGKYDSNTIEYEIMQDVIKKNTQTFMDEDIVRMMGSDILDSKKKHSGIISKLLNASMYGMQFSDKVSRGTSAMLAIEYGKEQYSKLMADLVKVNSGNMKLRDAQANFAKNIHINEFANDPLIKKRIMDSINYVNPERTLKDFLKVFTNAAVLQENFDYTNVGMPLVNSMIKAKGGVTAAAMTTFTSYPQYYVNNIFKGLINSYKNGDVKPLLNMAAFGMMLNFSMSKLAEESDNETVQDSANYVRTLSPYYTITAPLQKMTQSPAGILTGPIAIGLLAAQNATNEINSVLGIDEAPIDGYQRMVLKNMAKNEILSKSMSKWKEMYMDPLLEEEVNSD